MNKPPLKAVNEESQQSRACGVLYLVASTNGKNLNRQEAKFAKLDRGLDKREEDRKSCQGRPHELENRNGTTDPTSPRLPPSPRLSILTDGSERPSLPEAAMAGTVAPRRPANG